ncbi:hypothetical protein RND81_08G230400 [Saponaria officinalis]|uniref:ZF-HD dimerization-type domain-containing protein n=1 Tax=Saponaria officinalis TaxID=3572 RepID=A0AAW1JB00_SAPOF
MMMRRRRVVILRRASGETVASNWANDHSSSNNNDNSNNDNDNNHNVRYYGECQKNHAASIGGYAVDGCREFLASGDDGTQLAFQCAACHCHRSFHRRLL